MEKPIDVSLVISGDATVYPGDDPIEVSPICSITDSCPCKITKLGWTTHFLTHVDPPSHFIVNGKSLDEIPLDRFIVDAVVHEVFGDSVTSEDILSLQLKPGDSLLLKSRNSRDWDGSGPFDVNHVYISKAAAAEIANIGLNLVGFDYVSIDQYGNEEYPAHRAILGAGIIVLEGLALRHVSPGRYKLFALPLKIEKGDGSPVRAVLFRQ